MNELFSQKLGRGGDLLVSVLSFYSDDPSSNPADLVYSLQNQQGQIKTNFF